MMNWRLATEEGGLNCGSKMSTMGCCILIVICVIIGKLITVRKKAHPNPYKDKELMQGGNIILCYNVIVWVKTQFLEREYKGTLQT